MWLFDITMVLQWYIYTNILHFWCITLKLTFQHWYGGFFLPVGPQTKQNDSLSLPISESLVWRVAGVWISDEKGENKYDPCGWVRGHAPEWMFFEYFIFKSINLMHFERKIKQNYKTVWMYNKHGHIMLYKKWDWQLVSWNAQQHNFNSAICHRMKKANP